MNVESENIARGNAKDLCATPPKYRIRSVIFIIGFSSIRSQKTKHNPEYSLIAHWAHIQCIITFIRYID